MNTWTDVKRIDSTDTNVAKFVFENETAVAESVLYKYPTYQQRTVICCSTQSGCPIGCRFCGAGDHFVRSLTADEIVEQPRHLLSETGVDALTIGRLQIMFMSMGEPMLNLKELIPAMRTLYREFPNAALLVSTSGPDIDYAPFREVSWSIPTIGLQFSVHESTDEKRDALIPFKRKLTLRQISAEGIKWAIETKRRPYFNFCVHDGNNTEDDVSRLLKLFDPETWNATISVICERDEHVSAANARQRDLADGFMSRMLAAGYNTRVFDPAGQDDVGGGCGQLWFVQKWMQEHKSLSRPSIGSGLVKIHTPSLLK